MQFSYLIITNLILLLDAVINIIVMELQIEQSDSTSILLVQIIVGVILLFPFSLLVYKYDNRIIKYLFFALMFSHTLIQFELVLANLTIIFRVILICQINKTLITQVEVFKIVIFGQYVYYFIRLIILNHRLEYLISMILIFGLFFVQFITDIKSESNKIAQYKSNGAFDEYLSSNTQRLESPVSENSQFSFINAIKQGLIYMNNNFEIQTVNDRAKKMLGTGNLTEIASELHNILVQGLKQDDQISLDHEEFLRRTSHKQLTTKTSSKIYQNLIQTAQKRIKRIAAISEKLLDQKRKKRGARQSQIQDIESFKDLILSFFDSSLKVSSLLEQKRCVKMNKLKVSKAEKTFEIQFCKIIEINKNNGYLLLITDVTEVENLQTYIQKYQFQTFHFNSFSHELRTPLNCSLALLQALKTQLKTKQHIEEYLQPAIVQNKLLMHQINDILDFASFGIESFELNLKSFYLFQIRDVIFEYYQQACSLKSIELSFQIHNQLDDVSICSDFERIIQLLVNLINNSLKFTEPGCKIKLIMKEKIKSGMGYFEEQYIKFIVLDNGRGISYQGLEAINNILHSNINSDIKYQLKNFTNKYVGLGFTIGSQMSKELAVSNKSYFKVRSVENKFTKISFRVKNQKNELFKRQQLSLKFDKVDEEEQSSHIDACSPLTNHHQKLPSIGPTFFSNKSIQVQDNIQDNITQILLCDDVAFNLIALQLLLKNIGHRCDLAYDGQQAIQHVKLRMNQHRTMYKLIFMDIEMPVLNGYETSKIIKTIAPQAIIVFCSAYDSLDNRNLAVQCGMKDFLIKPVRVEHLQELLQKYLL